MYGTRGLELRHRFFVRVEINCVNSSNKGKKARCFLLTLSLVREVRILFMSGEKTGHILHGTDGGGAAVSRMNTA